MVGHTYNLITQEAEAGEIKSEGSVVKSQSQNKILKRECSSFTFTHHEQDLGSKPSIPKWVLALETLLFEKFLLTFGTGSKGNFICPIRDLRL